MASAKISYKDLKRDDNPQLAAIFGGKPANTSSYSTGFEKIPLEKIIEDSRGDFVELFPFDQEQAAKIQQSIEEKGYDKTQVIHVAKILEEPETLEAPIRIDGAHRTWAAQHAGIAEVPVYIHTFETRTEALIYAYELQLNRRNLAAHEKLAALRKLDSLKSPGKKAEDNDEPFGKSSEDLAKIIGESPRTVERMRRINNSGDEQLIAATESGEKSIYGAEQELIKKRKAEKKAQEEEDNGHGDDYEILSETEGNPRPVVFNYSDGIERPTNKLTAEQDNERTRERRIAYLEGFSDGFSRALIFACSEIAKGRTAQEVYKDDRVADLSPSALSNFCLPEEAEDMVKEW